MPDLITPEVINKLSLEKGEEALLNAVGSEKEKTEANRELLGFDIHANLLQGLIPMSGPVGVGINNELIRAKCKTIDVPRNIRESYPALDSFNLPLIHYCITEAKKEGWVYFYMIVNQSSMGYIIRGC